MEDEKSNSALGSKMENGKVNSDASKMMVFVPTHPLVKHWVSVIRNKETSTIEFRNAMAELGRLIMYEATRDWLPAVKEIIQTPVGVATGELVDPLEPVLIVPILRAGLVLAEHASSLLPSTKTYHIGMMRDEKDLQPSVYLNKLPDKISKASHVLVVDPILATGGSMIAAINLLREREVDIKQIKVITALSCHQGIDKLSKMFPGLHIYTGVIDPILNEKGFIIPGLGDAGDRSFGTS